MISHETDIRRNPRYETKLTASAARDTRHNNATIPPLAIHQAEDACNSTNGPPRYLRMTNAIVRLENNRARVLGSVQQSSTLDRFSDPKSTVNDKRKFNDALVP